MLAVTSKNLLDFLQAYFSSVGLGKEAGDCLTAKNFSDGLILKLPIVCLVRKNRPAGSNSKQTHIHITGSSRSFFFPDSLLASAAKSSDDVRQPLQVSQTNIKALKGEKIQGEAGLALSPAHTVKKIAYREAQQAQVQISKLNKDSKLFLDLRNCLYENDLLIFLKYRTGDEMLAVGIPESFYEGNYEITMAICPKLEDGAARKKKPAVPVKKALTTVMEAYKDTDSIDGEEAIADMIYQEMIQMAPDTPVAPVSYEPETYNPSLDSDRTAKVTRPRTDPVLGKTAILQGNYQCAVNQEHPTFPKKDGTPYVEVHHLIPLGYQSKFANKLDTMANLVPL